MNKDTSNELRKLAELLELDDFNWDVFNGAKVFEGKFLFEVVLILHLPVISQLAVQFSHCLALERLERISWCRDALFRPWRGLRALAARSQR